MKKLKTHYTYTTTLEMSTDGRLFYVEMSSADRRSARNFTTKAAAADYYREMKRILKGLGQ